MNKLISKIKFIATFLVIVAMCIPTMKAQAAVDSYTVTFRPGNVGYFAMEKTDAEVDKQAEAKKVADAQYVGLYGADNVTVTKNGAIKVTVPANAAVPSAPIYIQAESGYFVKDAAVWGPATGQLTDKNMDFVVDYGKLVNGVEYTVEYVDSSSGESIAPVYIAQANIGDEREVTAPKQIVISEATVYNLTSEETLTLVLDADSTKNVFTFSYTMAPRGTVEEEVVNYVDGGTVTIDETFTTFIDNGTTVTTIPAQGGAGGGDAEGGNEPGAVVIEDEQVPLAPPASEEDGTGNMVSIGDEDVPLASFGDESGANTVAIVAGIFVVAAIAALILWLRMKKKKDVTEETTSDKSEE